MRINLKLKGYVEGTISLPLSLGIRLIAMLDKVPEDVLISELSKTIYDAVDKYINEKIKSIQ
ncbi:MAG: hypothetical protein JZD41_02570 [Thermoproteus sp.]|nr:hypothetical protein [Thermoproteus sp.]